MKRLALALPVLTLLFAGAAQASPLFDNLGAPVTLYAPAPLDAASGVGPVAQSFFSDPTLSYLFTELKVEVVAGKEGDGGFMTVNLLTDSGGSPNFGSAQLLGKIFDTGLSSSTVVTLTGFSKLLLPNMTYWIELETAGGSGQWVEADDDSGSRVSGTSFYFDNGGFPAIGGASDGAMVMFVGQVGSIPEPLTLSLFGAGLAGAAGLRRRKKSD